MQFMANATKAGILVRFLQGYVTCLAREEKAESGESGRTWATKFTSSLGSSPSYPIKQPCHKPYISAQTIIVYRRFVDTVCGIVLDVIMLK